MARHRVEVNLTELQEVINQLEGQKLYSSPHKLFDAVANTPWAASRGITAVMVYLRVKEVNVDPDNPVIHMKVKRARRLTPRQPGEEPKPRARKSASSVARLDVLLETFRARGIEVTDAADLITSSHRSREENRAVLLAWADLRDRFGCPKPTKAEVPVSAAPASVGVSPEEPVVSPGAADLEPVTLTHLLPPDESGTGSGEGSTIAPEAAPVEVVTVVEESPAGEPLEVLAGVGEVLGVEVAPAEPVVETVSEPTVVEVGMAEEPVVEMVPDPVAVIEPAVALGPMLPPAPVAPAMSQVAPIQAPVRTGMARPQPVRSSLPPRPMPARPQPVNAPTKSSWGGIFDHDVNQRIKSTN